MQDVARHAVSVGANTGRNVMMMSHFKFTNAENFMSKEKSKHQKRVDQFMRLAGQIVNDSPTVPSKEVRLSRAKLILEEALETVYALGFTPYYTSSGVSALHSTLENIGFDVNPHQPNLAEIADGCLDLRVVSTGTLSACGISDKEPQRLVDENNLQKFGAGSYRDSNGKWIKPPGHKPPDLDSEIERQTKLNSLLY